MSEQTAPGPAQGSVGKRQPCPCGSGKRYKACHGKSGGAGDVMVIKPFDGLAAECELIALREFVPAATAKLPMISGDRDVYAATVLPMAAAAMVRTDGTAYVGLQVQTRSGDVSRDLARAVQWAQQAEPGQSLSVVGPETDDTGGMPSRLQDVISADSDLDVQIHSDFSWWLPEGVEPSGEVALSLERANAAIKPTEQVRGKEDAASTGCAYWIDAEDKAHIRWVRPEPEEQLLSGLARLSARGELGLDSDTRFAGSFRAHGLLVPVWDLDREKHPREWEEPAAQLATRLDEAVKSLDSQALDSTERRALEGLRGRQITIR